MSSINCMYTNISTECIRLRHSEGRNQGKSGQMLTPKIEHECPGKHKLESFEF